MVAWDRNSHNNKYKKIVLYFPHILYLTLINVNLKIRVSYITNLFLVLNYFRRMVCPNTVINQSCLIYVIELMSSNICM